MKIAIWDKKHGQIGMFRCRSLYFDLNLRKKGGFELLCKCYCFSPRAKLTKKMQKMAEKIAFTQKVTELF